VRFWAAAEGEYAMKKTVKPFGLELLAEVKDADLLTVNGGSHHKKKPHPIFTTMHVSMPQPAFPKGDNG
jgi:hypothetical protein